MDNNQILFELNKKNYQKLKKYIVKNENKCKIKVNTDEFIQIKITKPLPSYLNKIIIHCSCDDLIRIDNFFIDNKINCDFGLCESSNIRKIMISNCVDALDYLIETRFRLCPKHSPNLNEEEIIYYFFEACKLNHMDMILYFKKYLDPLLVDVDDHLKDMIIENFNVVTVEHLDPEIFCLLLDTFPIEYLEIYFVIINFIKDNNLRNIELLLERCPTIDLKEKEYLKKALSLGFVDIAEFLLSRGANFDDIDVFRILKDSFLTRKYHDMVEFLLINADLNQKQIDYLFRKSKFAGIEQVELLINLGANVKKYGKELYTKAKKCKNYHLAKFLNNILNNDISIDDLINKIIKRYLSNPKDEFIDMTFDDIVRINVHKQKKWNEFINEI